MKLKCNVALHHSDGKVITTGLYWSETLKGILNHGNSHFSMTQPKSAIMVLLTSKIDLLPNQAWLMSCNFKNVEQRSIKSKLLYSMSSSCTPPGLFPTKTHYSPFSREMCQISLTAIWRVRIVLMLSRNSKSFDPHEHFTFYLQHYISSWVISCCTGAFYGCWKSSRMQKKKEMCLFFTDGKQKTLWGVKSGSWSWWWWKILLEWAKNFKAFQPVNRNF